MSLATKYRPNKWESVVGQKSIVEILSQQLLTQNIKNTYIFSGASGCGKTTIARLFAMEINKGRGTPIEIDGASNSGVDNVRQIVETSKERSIDSEYKIYIIDECHALSNQAWQAFLKCIEEPPKYTIFIFCTTDPHKIPDTIKNRCMRFNFSRIESDLIYNRLLYICEQEKFINYDNACDYISRICNGELRNAISLLETCADYNIDLNIDNVVYALGNYSYDVYFNLVNNIIDGKTSECFSILSDIYKSGSVLEKFVDSFLDFNLDITKYLLCQDIGVTKFPISVEKDLKFCTAFDNASSYYFYIIDKLLELKQMIKSDSNVKSTIEVMFSKMCRLV